VNGIHDMGGMHGFGKLPLDDNEPVFHHAWEARVLATNLALSPHLGSNVDRFRYLIESMSPADYLTSSYYERWLASILAACAEQELLSAAELSAIERGQEPPATEAQATAIPASAIRNIVTGGKPAQRDHSGASLFSVGQTVRARNLNPAGHTRLVRYARGKRGEILADNGKQVLADDNAMHRAARPERIYNVRFSARELWGDSANPRGNPRDSVCIDLWESYLEHV
jgi:nitrile hydratase beta subunit